MKIQSMVITLFLSTTTMMAQFTVSGDLHFMSDDNVDNNYLHISDRITTPSLTVKYSLSEDVQEANLFYTGALNYYSFNRVRTYQYHLIGGEYSRAFGDESETTLNAKLSFDTRIDRAEFALYDYSQFIGSASVKHFFTETSLGQASYNFRSMSFRELIDFNYTEHVLSAKYSQQFSTGTTVILNTELGGKIYSSSSDSMLFSGTTGRGKSGSNQLLPSVIQTIGSLRIGQSVWEGTGMSVLAQYQWNLRKQTRYMTSENGFMSDDEIFDDHYGYEGLMLQAMLTQKLPFDAQVRFIVSSHDRVYSNLPAYDLLGNQIAGQRNDIRTTSTINFTKSFESLGIDLNVSYDYIINSSNDMLYDYTNNAFAIGVSMPF